MALFNILPLPASESFKDSRDYLERQQNIDLLIALARVAEVSSPGKEMDTLITVKIKNTLEKL